MVLGADSAPLRRLAEAAGLAVSWQDVHGHTHTVSDETLQALLDAMKLECGDGVRIECSLRQLHEEQLHAEGRMIVAEAGEPIVFRHDGAKRYRLEYESGAGGRDGEAHPAPDGCVRLDPVHVTGYHHLLIGGRRQVLAIAPHRCIAPPALCRGGVPWGIAAQVYSLRRQSGLPSAPILETALRAGDYGALAKLAQSAGRQGASALAISPVHALFSADPSRYSPYAPSSRLFLNTAYIEMDALGLDALRAALSALPESARISLTEHATQEIEPLIDWSSVQPSRMAIARQLFEHFEAHATSAQRSDFDAYWRKGGEALQNHCLYETLHAHYLATLGPANGWQDWPVPMRDPARAAAQAFARQHGPELRFHGFMQWLADKGMCKARHAAREAGMPIGLITDLAIGTDPRGSQAWSAQQSFLQGATVGAAPDLYYAQGQDWGLTAFSPLALRATGYAHFLAILRSALAHAGGVRIDHVLGLARLWLVPQGMSATEGAFLHYPLNDLLRLLALESERHQAVIVGENLGTVPPGFNARLSDKGILGTSVLWFERNEAPPRQFIPVRNWPASSMATTTTHDLPTVAGWWQGRDIEWLRRLERITSSELDDVRTRREKDKRLLVQAISSDRAVPDAAPVAEAIGWVASSPASLCVFPLEDILALPDQPNLPGPSLPDGAAHPNWLRRLPFDAETLFSADAAQRSLAAIRRGRSKP